MDDQLGTAKTSENSPTDSVGATVSGSPKGSPKSVGTPNRSPIRSWDAGEATTADPQPSSPGRVSIDPAFVDPRRSSTLSTALGVCSNIPSVSSSEPRRSSFLDGSSGLKPLIIHMDVNKSIILSDSVQAKKHMDTIREAVAAVFYGTTRHEASAAEIPGVVGTNRPSGNLDKLGEAGDGVQLWWEWDGFEPQLSVEATDNPPDKHRFAKILSRNSASTTCSYLDFVRKHTKGKGKAAEREALDKCSYVWDTRGRDKMEKVAQQIVKRMTVPAQFQQSDAMSAETLESCGIANNWLNIFPAFFYMVAMMQRSGRKFAIYFRSFGTDLRNVQKEWNSFCERRHPIHDHLLADIGSMDGLTEGVPDRRLVNSNMHTMYRDADGPTLALATLTDGPNPGDWDKWARDKDENGEFLAKDDNRRGRQLFDEKGCQTVVGYPDLRSWWKESVSQMRTSAVKEDWAWWRRNGEVAIAGKPLICVEGTTQVFLDDSIGGSNGEVAKIVDARDYYLMPIPFSQARNTLLYKVCPVSAVLDSEYFFKAVAAMELRQHTLDLEQTPTSRRRSVGTALYGIGGAQDVQLGSWMDSSEGSCSSCSYIPMPDACFNATAPPPDEAPHKLWKPSPRTVVSNFMHSAMEWFRAKRQRLTPAWCKKAGGGTQTESFSTDSPRTMGVGVG